MLTITIPGAQALQLEHLVLDFNGTLACDGELLTALPGWWANWRGICSFTW